MPLLYVVLMLGQPGPLERGSESNQQAPLLPAVTPLVSSSPAPAGEEPRLPAPPPPMEDGSHPPAPPPAALPLPADAQYSDFPGGITVGAGCPTGGDGLACPSCEAACPYCSRDDDKGLVSTCDLYPHFAYYPRYHGSHYFRPYNYTHVAGHQCFASSIGLDPRMPYSLTGFDRIYAGFPEKYPPSHTPIGTALPMGSGLPELEKLLTATPNP
uniref:Uncharacterized protein n=1 Tax=Schlesneria paludicola TaxID=360056 RepID=A0A7C2NYR4_9PLAN